MSKRYFCKKTILYAIILTSVWGLSVSGLAYLGYKFFG